MRKLGKRMIRAAAVTLTVTAALTYVFWSADTVKAKTADCPYVVTDVKSSLNVRASASENAEIVGKLYAHCYGEIIQRIDGWTLIRSGNLTGWAKNEYLLFGSEAMDAIIKADGWLVTVDVNSLRLRSGASADAEVYAMLSEGTTLKVLEEFGDWFKVDFDGYTGYVLKKYVTQQIRYGKGETNAEITRRHEQEAEEKRKAQEDKAARRAALLEEQKYVEEHYTDLELMAALIWCEAGNQPYEGMLAVGAVVMNRVENPSFPNTIPAVIYAPGQFTPAITGKVKKALERGVPDACVQAAVEAMSGVSNVGDRLYFNTVDIKSSDLIIGAHAFW